MGKEDILNTNPIVSTALSTIIGIALIGDMTAQEQNALGNWLMLIAQVLITNAASQNVIQTRTAESVLNINSKEVKSKYSPLYYNIDTLIEVLKTVNPEQYNSSIDLLKKAMYKMNQEIDNIKKASHK